VVTEIGANILEEDQLFDPKDRDSRLLQNSFYISTKLHDIISQRAMFSMHEIEKPEMSESAWLAH
jgi:hypothetical protein